MGLTISIRPDGYCYDYVVVEKKKAELHVLNYGNDISDYKELKLETTNKYPLVVSVQGKGVLSKPVGIIDEDTEETLISKVLPNAEAKDFYISKPNYSINKGLVSVIRKETCEQTLELLPGNRIISLSIGANQISILPQLIDNTRTWYFNNQQWILENKQVKISKPTVEDRIPDWQKVGDERIPTACLEAYAHVIAYFAESLNGSISLAQVDKNKKELLFSKLFMLSGWTILILLFSILLINFLLFDNYNKKFEQLNAELQQNSMVLAQMDTLSKQVEFKENFIEYNNTGQTKYSFYIDRLADLLPKNIVLVDLYVQPFEKRIKQGKETLVEKDKFVVKGVTKNSTILNSWVKDIQKEDWVFDTELIEYNREAANLSGEFELAIDIKKN
jgi:hypothetical protein